MKLFVRFFPAGYFVISVSFVVCAIALLGFAIADVWNALSPWNEMSRPARLDGVPNGIALLTIAVASLKLGQTIFEEEVQVSARPCAPVSPPCRRSRALARA